MSSDYEGKINTNKVKVAADSRSAIKTNHAVKGNINKNEQE